MNNEKFVFIQPKNAKIANSRKSIRVGFSKNRKGRDGFLINILLGKDIAEAIGLLPKNKVAVGYSTKNNRTIIIKRSDIGYALNIVNNKKNHAYYRITFNWSVFKPNANDMIAKKVKYTITDSKDIILDLD
jgi:hypothetical protein